MGAEILAYHGWAYDSTFWNPLMKLHPIGIRFKVADRGYFGNPEEPEFNASGQKIIFAHSLGLHLIPDRILAKADILVLMASFEHFIPSDSQRSKLVLRLLKRMRDKLPNNPEKVIQDFRSRAESHDSSGKISKELNVELLMQDLILLEESRIDISHLPVQQKFIVEAENDQIYTGADMKKFDKDQYGYYKIPAAGHAFPLTQAEDCFSIIKQAIPILGHHE